MLRTFAAAWLICLAAAMSPAAANEPASVTANTWRLPKEAPRPSVRIDAAAWLAGQYVGSGLGGEVEYQWLPPRADAMYGTFRLINKDGRTAFSEILQLAEVDGTLTLRVKHFTAEFVAWEEKDKFVEFRLVAAAADELRFDGLTLRRTPDGLRIHLAMRREQQLTEQVMELKRL
jgi:hypothetical protein